MGVSASYNALADLFECVSNFLRRFQIYAEKISFQPAMSDIVVKIMVELLSVLALATKQINQGRFSKWYLHSMSNFPRLIVLQRNLQKSYSERAMLRPPYRDWADSPKRKLAWLQRTRWKSSMDSSTL